MSDPVYGYYTNPERSRDSATQLIASLFVDYKNAKNEPSKNEILVKMIDCFMVHKLNIMEFNYLPNDIKDLIIKGSELKEQFNDYKNYLSMNLKSAAENIYKRILEQIRQNKIPPDLINKLINDPKLITDDKIRELRKLKNNTIQN